MSRLKSVDEHNQLPVGWEVNDPENDKTGEFPVLWDSVINFKGDLIAGGVSEIIELSASGYAVKSPWPGAENAACRQDLTLEARIYETLGQHERLVKIEDWDPDECVLTMEYMRNGCLQDYIDQHNTEIVPQQRLQWALDTAEGLQLLHTSDVLYCHLKAKNLLLDADLRIKVADFGGSSLRGSKPTSCAGTRYMPPGDFSAFSVHVDLLALGSTIYKIMTGQDPHEDIPSEEVWPLYREGQFPDVSCVLCGEIIRKCWLGEARSAQEVYDTIDHTSAALGKHNEICWIACSLCIGESQGFTQRSASAPTSII